MQQEYHSLIWIIFDNNQTITSWCKIEDNYGYELSLESKTFFLIIEKSYISIFYIFLYFDKTSFFLILGWLPPSQKTLTRM